MKNNTAEVRKKFITEYFRELKQAIDNLDITAIEKVIGSLMEAYKKKRTVFIIGNGGSASTASHMACDFGKGTVFDIDDDEEPRFRVISLTDNVPLITAYANDVSYEDIFVQQLINLIGKDDVVIALSVSGNSKNIIKAVSFARRKKATTIGILGFKTGGKIGKMVDIALIADSNRYGPCEDIQLILEHIMTSWITYVRHSAERR